MTNSQTDRAVQLADGQTNPPVLVSASMIRNLASTRLEEIESRWKPAREQMAQIREGSEHGHWDWRNKIWSTESGRHRLVAIECCGDVQGLMAILSQPCPTALGVEGSPVLYVDYLEVAPWNLKGLPSPPRFLGVGTLLIAEAVRLSSILGGKGELGSIRYRKPSGFTRRSVR